MKIITACIAFLFVANSLFATGGSNDNKSDSEDRVIEGKVIDQTNGDELTGVRVQIEGTDMVTYTDRYGNFTFENLPCSDCQVKFSYISFEELELKLSEVSTKNKIALSSK
jgi:hypothetical protein